MKNFKKVTDPPSQKASDGRRNFVKKIESFICGNCGFEVKGDGYTDHCPKCLFGKHVDEEIPGDRASECRALMEPIETSYQAGQFKIHYRCSKCRHEFWVRAADAKAMAGQGRTEGDNRELLMELMIK